MTATAAQAAEATPEVPEDPTRPLRSPTVSATSIAFAYANNIWIVPRAGGEARRLTSFQGQARLPRFSPDGRWLAFSGEYALSADGKKLVYRAAAPGTGSFCRG